MVPSPLPVSNGDALNGPSTTSTSQACTTPANSPAAATLGNINAIHRSPAIFDAWKKRARALKREVHALYLACKDPRTPWYAKAVGVCVIGYALSPIDLIPDPIPVLGYLDDLVIVPIGLLFVRRLIPPTVLTDCRQKAEAAAGTPKPTHWIAATVIIAIWIALAALGAWWLYRMLH